MAKNSQEQFNNEFTNGEFWFGSSEYPLKQHQDRILPLKLIFINHIKGFNISGPNTSKLIV
jgi:hypothetical protein